METDLSTQIGAEGLVPHDLIADAEEFAAPEDGDAPDEQQIRQLSMLLRSLCTFFKVRNHPLSEAEAAEVWARDFVPETRVAREVLLRSARLALSFAPSRGGEASAPSGAAEVMTLAESLLDTATICDAMLAARKVSLDSFTSLGKMIGRALGHSPAAVRLQGIYADYGAHELQSSLQLMIEKLGSDKLISDVRRILVDLARFVDYLRWIEIDLKRDRPLKQSLAAFTLIHEEAQTLLDFIEKRALRQQTDVEPEVFDVLDSTGYALNMELRKVFGYELVGLSALRQAPVIYVKVEQAHGLLSNCFQQSTVTLAQAFEPTIDGAQLFQTFQTRFDQSVELCRDLWHLLKFVRRASHERDRYPISSFKARLKTFREGSLRYLMYKDWETYERFAEEIGGATGAVELSPVLHRFDCYLETLLGQVRMRAVLANHPLDFLTEEAPPINA